MHTILFIDMDFHNKTRSSHFLLDILSKYYEIECHWEGNAGIFENGKRVPNLKKNYYDVLVYWQVTSSIKYIVPRVRVKSKVFFPMYDNVPDLTTESETLCGYLGNLVDFKIISFCKKIFFDFFVN